MPYRAYLLDIEGTTTPIDFVTRTLFPYARARLSRFVEEHHGDPQLQQDAALLAAEFEADLTRDSEPAAWSERPSPIGMAPYLEWLMDRDRKSTGLKSIQGRIWEEGYRSGELKGELYPDVESAMRRWKEEGARIAIFSSGSVLAQKLLFAHSVNGDLTPLIDDYFDTTTGPKRESPSYYVIAASLHCSPENVLFLSDVPDEVEAAKATGMSAMIVDRQATIPDFPHMIRSFDDIS